MTKMTTTDKIIESQKEALAIELLARFAHKTFGRNGVWNDEVKKHFVDGALWAFSRYEAIDSVIGEQPKIDLNLKEIERLKLEIQNQNSWLSPVETERTWQINQIKKIYPGWPENPPSPNWQILNALIIHTLEYKCIEPDKI